MPFQPGFRLGPYEIVSALGPWAPDGTRFLFTVAKGPNATLWTYSLQDKQMAPYGGIESPRNISATFSPDGRWVTYVPGAPPAIGIFVQPFPATSAKYEVFAGIHPFWSPDGRELFGVQRGRFVAVPVTTSPTFVLGNAVDLIRGTFIERGPTFERPIDIMPDGKRFVVIVSGDEPSSGTVSAPQIQVVEHWFEELESRVPVK